jgi:hypothetical protein
VEPNSAQTIATFTGTLLRRERHPAKQLVQLVFREDGQNWLCVSSNPATAKLDVGKDYRIEGTFKQLGERPFIHEPSISLIKQRKLALKIGLGAGIAILLIGATAAGLSFMPDNNQPHYSTGSNDATAATTEQSTDNSAAVSPRATTPPETQTSPPAPTVTTTTKPKITPKTTASSTSTTSSTIPASTLPSDPAPTSPDPGTSDPGTTNPGTTDPGPTPPPDPGTPGSGTPTTP